MKVSPDPTVQIVLQSEQKETLELGVAGMCVLATEKAFRRGMLGYWRRLCAGEETGGALKSMLYICKRGTREVRLHRLAIQAFESLFPDARQDERFRNLKERNVTVHEGLQALPELEWEDVRKCVRDLEGYIEGIREDVAQAEKKAEALFAKLLEERGGHAIGGTFRENPNAPVQSRHLGTVAEHTGRTLEIVGKVDAKSCMHLGRLSVDPFNTFAQVSGNLPKDVSVEAWRGLKRYFVGILHPEYGRLREELQGKGVEEKRCALERFAEGSDLSALQWAKLYAHLELGAALDIECFKDLQATSALAGLFNKVEGDPNEARGQGQRLKIYQMHKQLGMEAIEGHRRLIGRLSQHSGCCADGISDLLTPILHDLLFPLQEGFSAGHLISRTIRLHIRDAIDAHDVVNWGTDVGTTSTVALRQMLYPAFGLGATIAYDAIENPNFVQTHVNADESLTRVEAVEHFNPEAVVMRILEGGVIFEGTEDSEVKIEKKLLGLKELSSWTQILREDFLRHAKIEAQEKSEGIKATQVYLDAACKDPRVAADLAFFKEQYEREGSMGTPKPTQFFEYAHGMIFPKAALFERLLEQYGYLKGE